VTSPLATAVTTKPWAAHDTRLVLVTLGGIAIIILLIVAVKVHPFLSLIAGSAAPWKRSGC
jgi:GntP family gluconate:H+ symporter